MTRGNDFEIHPHYQTTVDFCELYDQCAFDPAYESLPIAFFEPMIERVLAKPGKGMSDDKTAGPLAMQEVMAGA